MMSRNDDIDVLAKPAPVQAQYVVPENAPVLPSLASQCDCELVVNEDGMAMVLFTKTMPEGIHWAEYDIDLSLLTFVTWSGRLMGLGMKVHVPFRKYLKMADEITLVQMTEDGKDCIMMYPVDLVVRHIGI